MTPPGNQNAPAAPLAHKAETPDLGIPGADRAAAHVRQKALSVLLDDIEQRANAATPGPWRASSDGGGASVDCPGQDPPLLNLFDKENWETADFIAAARSDVPKLHAIAKMYVAELEFHGRHKKLAEIASILEDKSPK